MSNTSYLDEGSILGGTDDILCGEGVCENGTVRCIFSKLESIKVGTGTTTRRHYSKQYYFVQGREDDVFVARLINEQAVPVGEDMPIARDELMRDYSPELQFYEEEVLPAMERLENHLNEGDTLREDGKFYSAGQSYNAALGMDEQNLRGLFGLGLVYLELDDEQKARDMMDQILKVESVFDGKNQHLFNEFGIKLRKARLYEDAVRYYREAATYAQNDENLFYNLARANYERNDWTGCAEALVKCHVLNPEMKEAVDLINIVKRICQNSGLCRQLGKAPVPRMVREQVLDICRMDQDAPAMSAETMEVGGDAQPAEVGRARTGGVVRDLDSIIDS